MLPEIWLNSRNYTMQHRLREFPEIFIILFRSLATIAASSCLKKVAKNDCMYTQVLNYI